MILEQTKLSPTEIAERAQIVALWRKTRGEPENVSLAGSDAEWAFFLELLRYHGSELPEGTPVLVQMLDEDPDWHVSGKIVGYVEGWPKVVFVDDTTAVVRPSRVVASPYNVQQQADGSYAVFYGQGFRRGGFPTNADAMNFIRTLDHE